MPCIFQPLLISGQVPYLSYSVYFIDNDWNLQSRCLQTLFVPKDHNADNLNEILKKTLAQWKLEAGKQVCITIDNGSNIICATTVRLVWTHLRIMFWTQLALSCYQFHKGRAHPFPGFQTAGIAIFEKYLAEAFHTLPYNVHFTV